MKLFLRTVLLFSCCWLASPSTADDNLPVLGDPTAALMSADQEYRLGRAWLRSLRGQTSIMSDPMVQEYVESLVYRLASYSDLKEPNLDIVVINSRQINAFAVPGGVIGLNAGLFLDAESEDEVAGVIAHEIAHVSQRHFARRYLDSKNEHRRAGRHAGQSCRGNCRGRRSRHGRHCRHPGRCHSGPAGLFSPK